MTMPKNLKIATIVSSLVIIALFMSMSLSSSSPRADARALFPWEFSETSEQGFGDRQNNAAWSMAWWDGKLYVGTVRSWLCWSQAWFNKILPTVPYPPDDPDMECSPDPLNLPLQAEIWRYTPETETWERLYQSPNDVEIPGHPGRYTARDIGYRDLLVFEEPDGTEALYACGVTINTLWPLMPPPRILRSTDGTTFEPIPQDPGTILGDLGQDQATFRDLESYNGRLYVINGEVQGHGSVLESDDPAGGNDTFRWITPKGMKVFEMAPYNGYFFVGTAEFATGYRVLKTDASGEPPYTYETVVADGGYLEPFPSSNVVSMHIFQGRLYVGGDKPAELIRINPDDSWDLIAGTPRETPDGWKYPLSGMDAGFDWPWNVHVWKMQEHDGVLYVGTADESTRFASMFGMEDEVSYGFGFDFYRSSDGQHFGPLTTTGFGQQFQMGIRSMASSPQGLFIGTVDYWYGLKVYQGVAGDFVSLFFPFIGTTGLGTEANANRGTIPPVALGLQPTAPQRLETEITSEGVILSWEALPNGYLFRIFRSDFQPFESPDMPNAQWRPGPFEEIGSTTQAFFFDANKGSDQPAHYYIVAEDGSGRVSPPSNLARAPSLAPATTFRTVDDQLERWLPNAGEATGGLAQILQAVKDDVAAKRFDSGLGRLAQLGGELLGGRQAELAPWQAADLEILLAKLAQRIRLAQTGMIDPSTLE